MNPGLRGSYRKVQLLSVPQEAFEEILAEECHSMTGFNRIILTVVSSIDRKGSSTEASQELS